MSTPRLAALRMKEAALQGFAKMRFEGSIPPMSSTCEISLLEAQSNPAPNDARSLMTYGSGLHLTAVEKYIHGELDEVKKKCKGFRRTIERLNFW